MNRKRIMSLLLVIAMIIGSCSMLCGCSAMNLVGSVGVSPDEISPLKVPADFTQYSMTLAADLFRLDQCFKEDDTKAALADLKFETVLQEFYTGKYYDGEEYARESLKISYGWIGDDQEHRSGFSIGHGYVGIEGDEKGYQEAYLITIRPTTGREWYSNFDTDGSGNNFRKTAEMLEEVITDNELLEKLQSKDVIVIVSGYSRGAAVGNVLEAWLASKGCKVYGYNFACPYVEYYTGTFKQRPENGGIFNFNAPGDLFTHLPIVNSESNSHRYGTDIVLDGKDCSAALNGLFGALETIVKAQSEIKKKDIWLGDLYSVKNDCRINEIPIDLEIVLRGSWTLADALTPLGQREKWTTRESWYRIETSLASFLVGSGQIDISIRDFMSMIACQVLTCDNDPYSDILTKLSKYPATLKEKYEEGKGKWDDVLTTLVTLVQTAQEINKTELTMETVQDTLVNYLGFNPIDLFTQHMADNYFALLK